jgi:signal transduction histidine kinase
MRWALARVAIAVTAMVAIAFVVPLGIAIGDLAQQRAEEQAQAQVNAIEPLLAVTTDRIQLSEALATMSDAPNIALVLPDGSRLGTGRASAQQLAQVLNAQRAETLPVPGGSALVQPEAVTGSRLALIEVFIGSGDQTAGVVRGRLIVGALALALVAASTLAADRLASRIVRPARRLAQASRLLGEGDTAVRVDATGPRELREAGLAFNAMADRVVQLLASERELAADLSHRLRTPLTALKVNVNALGEIPAAAAAREAVQRLEQEVDSIIRTTRGGATGGPSDLSAVVADRMEFWSVLAEDEERPWELVSAGGPIPVQVPAPELAAALDVLLGNVFRHTPEGTAFQVTVHPGEGGAALLVDDAGPGLNQYGRDTRRGEGSGEVGSTGLGLDIVRKLAERTGGSFSLDRSPLGGAQVMLRIPMAMVLGRDAGPRPRRRDRRR